MCLALVALNAHPRYPLLIAANRDEFHARPAAPASWWPDGTLAGRDLIAGGTWFGVRPCGRWALVTNYREGVPRDPNAPSRGALVTRMLNERHPPLVETAAIARDGERYHGFNLLAGDVAIHHPRSSPGGRAEIRESLRDYEVTAAYASNRASGAIALANGVHGLSNHLLETPWPKLVSSKAALARLLERDELDVSAVFELLADRMRAQDGALPATGVSRRWEHLLSSPFIVDAEYGTRCSTVFRVEANGAAKFIERSFDAAGSTTSEVAYAFAIAER